MMGTTMVNPSCEWIRGRLPLSLGDGEAPDPPGDEAVDLGLEDRRAIERHLADCPGCRRHRSELAGAIGALAVAAGAVPVAPDAPSLWPSLERRITARALGGDPVGVRRAEPVDRLDDDRPLRSAWNRDTLRELAETAGLGAWPGPPRLGSWRVVGVSLAASALMIMVVVPVSWQLRAGAEERMLVNAEPAPAPVGPPAWLASSPADADAPAPDPGERRRLPARERLQAAAIQPPAGPTPVAVAPAAAASKPQESSLLGFDLEPGTPMPPDGRDARQIY
jgi:hypothetical protein